MQHRDPSHLARILGASLLATGLASALGATPAHAEQFVLFDVTFDYTKMQADTSTPSQSHFYVKGSLINPARPTNWVSPVDYRNGTVHIRTEVMEKPPGGARTEWTLCYIPNRGQGNGYGCTGSGIYTEKGIYERDESMNSWWENQSIIWTAGIKQMDLVIKDGSGGGGHAHKRPDHEKYFPTKMRITMVQVSAGAKYDPSLVPNLTPRPVDAGTIPDANSAPDPDAGPTGTGGAAGSGGTPGATPGGAGPAPTPGTEPPSPPASGSAGTSGGTGATPPAPSGTGAPPASGGPSGPPASPPTTTTTPVSGAAGCALGPGTPVAPGAFLMAAVAMALASGRRRRRR